MDAVPTLAGSEADRPAEETVIETAAALLRRLERIDALTRAGASPVTVLGELQGLVGEAETWARLEGDDRAEAAVARAREAVERGAERFAPVQEVTPGIAA